jgi:hypothetical protein
VRCDLMWKYEENNKKGEIRKCRKMIKESELERKQKYMLK